MKSASISSRSSSERSFHRRSRSSGRRTLHKLATLGDARAGTIDGRCQNPPGCLQSRYIAIELAEFSFRHYPPPSRCFSLLIQREQQPPDFSNLKAGLLCRAYDLQSAYCRPRIIAAGRNPRRRVQQSGCLIISNSGSSQIAQLSKLANTHFFV